MRLSSQELLNAMLNIKHLLENNKGFLLNVERDAEKRSDRKLCVVPCAAKEDPKRIKELSTKFKVIYSGFPIFGI